MGGLAPGLGSVSGFLSASLIMLHTFRFGARCGRCSRAVTRGLEIRALDGVSTQSLAGFGCESLWQGSAALGFGGVFG
jgi:hypothetical protein